MKTTQWTKSDTRAIAKIYTKQYFPPVMLACLIPVLFGDIYSTVFCIIVIMPLLYLIFFKISYHALHKYLRAIAPDHHIEIRATDQGIQYKTAATSSFYSWRVFKGVKIKKGFLIFDIIYGIFLIPCKEASLTDKELKLVLQNMPSK